MPCLQLAMMATGGYMEAKGTYEAGKASAKEAEAAAFEAAQRAGELEREALWKGRDITEATEQQVGRAKATTAKAGLRVTGRQEKVIRRQVGKQKSRYLQSEAARIAALRRQAGGYYAASKAMQKGTQGQVFASLLGTGARIGKKLSRRTDYDWAKYLGWG